MLWYRRANVTVNGRYFISFDEEYFCQKIIVALGSPRAK